MKQYLFLLLFMVLLSACITTPPSDPTILKLPFADNDYFDQRLSDLLQQYVRIAVLLPNAIDEEQGEMPP